MSTTTLENLNQTEHTDLAEEHTLENRRFLFFYQCMFITSLLPFLAWAFPFIPGNLLGLNMTGWAWTLMLVGTLLILPDAIRHSTFPLVCWLPWSIYIVGYLIYDYTYLGLQLTSQFLLPIMIGVVASSFTYDETVLRWLFHRFKLICFAVIAMFIYGYLFRGGWGPHAAATPMLLSILGAIIVAAYYTQRKTTHLLAYGALFIIPFVYMTRMGIAVFIAILVFHIANMKLSTKVTGALIGATLLLVVFHSQAFQEKSFHSGYGTLNDIHFNYYETEGFNISGRSTWRSALEPGLRASPIWGNGPRADNAVLSIITGQRGGEAHNDYLAVAYNYGYVGLMLLLGGFVVMFVKLYILMKTANDYYMYLLITSSMTLFVAFGMFMYTDNILKYTIFFPNLFFAMVGIAFANYQAVIEDVETQAPGTDIN